MENFKNIGRKKTIASTRFVQSAIFLACMFLLSGTAFGQYTASGTGYNWENISGSGALAGLSDDSSTIVPIGFTFDFYGNNYTNVYICSNGYLSFGSGWNNLSGHSLPSATTPNNLIAGWWEDLDPPEGGTIHYQTLGSAGNRRLIVQFTNIQHYPSGNPCTFEFKLFEADSSIEVHYSSLSTDGATHYAGIENSDGTAGETYYSGGGTLPSNSAVRYTSAPPNTAPTTSGIGNVTEIEDAATRVVDLYLSFDDAESTSAGLTYDVTGNTNPGLFASYNITGDRDLNLDYAAEANGSANITVRATDPDGLSVQTTFAVTVNPVNDVPSFVRGADVTTDEDSGPQTVAGWTTAISRGPADEAGQALAFDVTNDNNAMFAVQPSVDALTGTLTYTGADDANGSATVTLILRDNGGTADGGVDTSPPQTFLLTINPVNDVPIFNMGTSQTVDEDAGPQSVPNWANSMSPGEPPNEAGQSVELELWSDNPGLFSSPPAVNAATGELTYTPGPDAFGSATVSVRIRDDGGTERGGTDTSVTRRITITVNEVNDEPSFTAGPDQAAVEGSGMHIIPGWASGISPGPANESGQTVTFFSTTDNNGLFSSTPRVSVDGTLAYTLDPDASGVANVTVTLQDNGGVANGGVNSFQQTFAVTVEGINDAPTFSVGPDQTVDEDSEAVSVTGWATSISTGAPNETGQVLTFHLANDNNGLFSEQPSVDETGTLTFTPAGDLHGVATVTLYLRDSGGTANGGVDVSPSETFRITVSPVNDAPVLDNSGDMALDPIPEDAGDSENPGTSVSDILAGGGVPISDIDDGALQGIAVIGADVANGAWQYDCNGNGIFVTFPPGLSESAAVLLDLPTIVRFVPATDFNGLADPGITFRAWDMTVGTVGTTGADTTSNGGTSAFSAEIETASITVEPVNDAPEVVQSDPVETGMSEDGSPVAFSLILDAIDVDGDDLTWTLSVPPDHGDASAGGTGESLEVEYTPDLHYNGPDTLEIEVSDGELTDTVTVNIDVGGIGDAPEIGEGDSTTVEMSEDGDTPFSLVLTAFDPDGDPLYWSVYTPAANGEASLGNPGPGESSSVMYNPPADFSGTDSFVIQVADGNFTDQITVNVNVLPVNDPPVIDGEEAVSVEMSDSTPFELTLSASDIDGDILTWSISSDPSNGSASASPSGEVSYESESGFDGTDTFTVQVSDGSATDTVDVEVAVDAADIDVTFKADGPRQGLAPHEVTFSYDSPNEITSVEWDFGDGGSSADKNPTHTYEKSGMYTVSLTVAGPAGEKTVEKEAYIEVLGLRTVSGTVSSGETGSGISGCMILIWLGDSIAADGVTDSEGRFELSELPSAENYILEITPNENFKKQFYNGQAERDLAERVSTMDGDRDLIITLEPASRLAIRGRVIGDSDNSGPLAGVRVDAYSQTADFSASETTGADGTYELMGLEPASDYVVSVTADGEYYYSIPQGETPGRYLPNSSAFFWDEATPVEPADPAISNIDIVVGPNQGAWIAGRVYAGEEPLEGIPVNAWSDALDSGASATTGADGSYKITGLVETDSPANGYVVDVWTDGYPYLAFDGSESRDSATLVQTGREDVDFHLESGYAISGTVRDTDGNPVAGVKVKTWSLSSGDEAETETDENGAFAIHDLPPQDDYVAAVYPEDYPVRFHDGKTSSSEADKLDLTSGDASGIDFTLDKGKVISGVIYAGDTQTPAPAGTVVVVCSESANTCVEAEIDESGSYEVSGLDPEVTDYVLSISSPGFQQAEGVAPSSGGNLVLETGHTIRGLVEQDGMPVSGVRVEACSNGNCGYAVTAGDASGGFNYEIDGMPAGTYTVTFESDEFEKQTATADVSGDTSGVNAAVSKGAGRMISGVIHNLKEGREIFVHARSKTKNASEVVSVTGGGTGRDEYAIRGLPPSADYQVEISSEYYAYQAYNGRNDWTEADYVDITEQDALGVDFTLEETNAVISGNVTFPPDAPSGEKARVHAVSPSTGAEGSVSIEYTGDGPVSYEITDLPSGDDYIVSVWPDNYKKMYYDGAAKEIDAKPLATDGDSADFVLDAGASISGTVTAEDVGGVRAEAWSESLEIGGGVPISEDGTYTIAGLERAADYVVKVEKPGAPPFYYNEEETAFSESLATPVSVMEENLRNIDITVPEGESITGTVRDKTGRPLAEVWVDAESESKGVGGGAYTADDGTFEIAGLPPGPDYTVTARPDWAMLLSVQEKTDVSTGDDLKFVLNDRTGYTLGGTIRDVADEHVPNVKVELRSDSLKFFQWSDMDRSGRHDLHVLNRYEFAGLPEADDFLLVARPPEDSIYAVLAPDEITVGGGDTELKVVMEPGTVVSGTVTEEFGAGEKPISGVRVTAFSKEKNFRGEAATDRNGYYEIPNAPEAADYVVTTRKKGYASKELANLYPGSETDFLLDTSGSITGTVKDKTTGKPVANLRVEARSDYMDGVPGYSGSAYTDKNGAYSVDGLRKDYRDLRTGESIPVEDYIVAVQPENYPRQFRGGKKPGDTADFMLSNSRGNRISGTVFGTDGLPVTVEVFEHGGGYVKSADVSDNGTFEVNGLDGDGLYQLRFTAFGEGAEYSQWAGEDGEGFDNPDPENGANPEGARVFETDTEVGFQFSSDAFSRRKRSAGPKTGPVRNLRSTSHEESAAADTVRNLGSPVSEFVSGDPNVTVTWDSTAEGAREDYHCVFNREPEFVITRRTAPKTPPSATRSATSGKLTGDDEQFYCHVAAIDDRGRIGATSRVGFRIDTVGPSNLNVKTLESSSRRYARLSLGATGATEVYISNINHGEGGEWENLAKTREWKRMEGGSAGKIYVQFRDRAKNVVNAPVIAEQAKQWQIRATAGTNGRILPFGNVMVNEGEDQMFTITPNDGYEVAEFTVNGEPATLENGTWTFRNVTEDASISATFREVWFTVTATAGPNGVVEPSGEIVIKKDSELVFAVTPDPGYEATLTLNGGPVMLAEDNTFRFINIDENHNLSVTFVAK